VGVYIGGDDRACAQPYLSAWWINRVERMGWHVFPLYVGPQAPCVNAPGNLTFAASQAASQGTRAAADAAVQAASLRLPHGTPVIYDMEAYSGCGGAVLRFIRAWDKKLRARGYGAAVYESFSNVTDLIRARHSMTEPDLIFYADWDGRATTNSPYMPSTMWAHHQRIHQYTGNTTQTWGGISISLDKDKLSANLGGGGGSKPPPPLQSRPQAAVVDAKGTVRVYNRGGGGPLWEDHYASGSPWSWQNLNGRWRSDPSAVLGTDGAVRLYAVGTNGRLYSKYLLPGGTWSSWWSLGGRWPWSAAALVTPNGRTRVFAVGTNGRLFMAERRTDGSWAGWRSLGGAHLRGTPAAITDKAGGVRVYVRGGSQNLREAYLAPGGNWAWSNLHGTWPADPAAVAGSDGTVRVYATGTNRRLFEDYLPVGGTWSGWQSRGGTTLTGVPAAVADHSGTVRVFTRGGGGTLHEAALAPGSQWSTDPAAVVGSDGTVRVYAVGAKGHIYERRLPPGGAWSPGWWWMGGH
jgi:Domain of unknown function (DUF1906)